MNIELVVSLLGGDLLVVSNPNATRDGVWTYPFPPLRSRILRCPCRQAPHTPCPSFLCPGCGCGHSVVPELDGGGACGTVFVPTRGSSFCSCEASAREVLVLCGGASCVVRRGCVCVLVLCLCFVCASFVLLRGDLGMFACCMDNRQPAPTSQRISCQRLSCR